MARDIISNIYKYLLKCLQKSYLEGFVEGYEGSLERSKSDKVGEEYSEFFLTGLDLTSALRQP